MVFTARLSSSATRRFISIAHAGFGVLVDLGVETLQQRPGEGCPGLSRERERVLQNLGGFAFHGLILTAGPLPEAMSILDAKPSNHDFGEVPDTTTRGRRRGRRRQGGLIPPSW
jgi:hypothetical protein